MKRLFGIPVFIIILSVIVMEQCRPKASPDLPAAEVNGTGNLEVMYFHFSNRCVTCITVEEQTLAALQNNFNDKIEQGVITFRTVTIDDEKNHDLVNQYKVAGQTLLVTNGKTTVDLTSEGFMYARSNPEKFHNAIKNAVNNLLL